MLIGIVGKPSAGKSTFLKAATLAEVAVASYPFTTIKANHAVGFVKVQCVDKDFDTQCNPREGYCLDGWRFVPVELLDVAGLVPGAHKGAGMGLQFLDDLRQAHALIHVIDISGSTNEKGERVPAGSHDPMKDVRFLEVELDMWYLSLLKKGWEKFARQTQQEKKEVHIALAKQLSGLRVTETMVADALKKLNLSNTPAGWSLEDLHSLASELRKKTKPMILACNKVDVPGAKKNLERLHEECSEYIIIGCSAESELALKEAAKAGLLKYIPGEKEFTILHEEKLTEKQTKALTFIKEHILGPFNSTGIQEILDSAVFDLLKYIAVFPGGVHTLEDQFGRVLPDCHLLPQNSTALEFAFRLHTDFGKHFIRAITIKNKMTVGKDYRLEHRDVIEIISGK